MTFTGGEPTLRDDLCKLIFRGKMVCNKVKHKWDTADKGALRRTCTGGT